MPLGYVPIRLPDPLDINLGKETTQSMVDRWQKEGVLKPWQMKAMTLLGNASKNNLSRTLDDPNGVFWGYLIGIANTSLHGHADPIHSESIDTIMKDISLTAFERAAQIHTHVTEILNQPSVELEETHA